MHLSFHQNYPHYIFIGQYEQPNDYNQQIIHAELARCEKNKMQAPTFPQNIQSSIKRVPWRIYTEAKTFM